jgi:hypothetical protein
MFDVRFNESIFSLSIVKGLEAAEPRVATGWADGSSIQYQEPGRIDGRIEYRESSGWADGNS